LRVRKSIIEGAVAARFIKLNLGGRDRSLSSRRDCGGAGLFGSEAICIVGEVSRFEAWHFSLLCRVLGKRAKLILEQDTPNLRRRGVPLFG
jgi:hypothetical protein